MKGAGAYYSTDLPDANTQAEEIGQTTGEYEETNFPKGQKYLVAEPKNISVGSRQQKAKTLRVCFKKSQSSQSVQVGTSSYAVTVRSTIPAIICICR